MRIEGSDARVEGGAVRFKVPHRRPGHPFVVRADRYRVVVIGTRFGVAVNGDRRVDVDVDEGVVEVWNNDVRLARLEPGQRWNSAPESDDATAAGANAGGEARRRGGQVDREVRAARDCRPRRRRRRRGRRRRCGRGRRRTAAVRRRTAGGASRCSATPARAPPPRSPGAARAALAAGDAPRALEIYKSLAQKTGPVARERRLRDRPDPERARPVRGGGRGLAALPLRLPERHPARRGGRVDHRDAGARRRNRRCADRGDRLPAPPARQRAARRDRARRRRSVPRARRLPARGRRVSGRAVGVARARRRRGRELLPRRLPRPRSATAAASMRCAATSAPTPTGASSGRRPSSSNRQRRRRRRATSGGRRYARGHRVRRAGVVVGGVPPDRRVRPDGRSTAGGGTDGGPFCTGPPTDASTPSRPRSWSRWIGRRVMTGPIRRQHRARRRARRPRPVRAARYQKLVRFGYVDFPGSITAAPVRQSAAPARSALPTPLRVSTPHCTRAIRTSRARIRRATSGRRRLRSTTVR